MSDLAERVIGAIDERAAGWARVARRHPLVNRVMYTLSMLGDDGRVWIGAAVFEASRRPRSLPSFLHTVSWLGIESATVNLGLKRVVERPRPLQLDAHAHRLRTPQDTSFPSGHASSAAAMAVILSSGSRLAPLWVTLAAGIGLSRVHVGVHHASDVLAGWAIGAAFGFLAVQLRPDGWSRPTR